MLLASDYCTPSLPFATTMSNMQPMNNFFEDWNIDPMLSSGQQLYASGATVSG